jgi:BirA family biotin operon repressor/biotin-[acetyl-CoA-carboxylase] ligase
MNKPELQDLLAPIDLVRHFYCYDSLDSSMNHARRILNGAASAAAFHGTVVFADTQTAGRGRHGRAWNAPAGSSILATIILSRSTLPGPANATQLSLLASAVPVAVCRGIASVLPGVRIKYPNDIVCDGRKLGGVLLEAQGDAILAGFGVNCAQEVADFPPDLKMPATSIFLETGRLASREQLVAAVLSELNDLLEPEVFATSGEEMRAICETLGRNIVLDIGQSKVLQGVARTITPEGMLILETESGLRQLYTSEIIRTWNPDTETPAS